MIKYPDKHSLQYRLILGMGAMLLPLIVQGVGVLHSLDRAIKAFDSRDSMALEQVFPAQDLKARIADASNAVNGCLVDLMAVDCDRFEQLSQTIEKLYAKLHSTHPELAEPDDERVQSVMVNNAEKKWQTWQAEIKSLYSAYRSGLPTRPLSRQVQKDLNRESQDIINAVDLIQQSVVTHQIQDNEKKANEIQKNVGLAIMSLSGLGLGLAIIAGWILARSILRPLSILQDGVNSLGEGKLSYRIHLPAQDELGQLAMRFNQMAETLEQNQIELINLATLDGLTGVYNRREFTTRFKVELERSLHFKQPCSLIMFDIDFFKKLNDTYGHQAGDEALKTVATLLKREVRPTDQVARYGGEEFAIILPQTSARDAVMVAERLRQKLMSQAIVISEQQSIQVTASIGVATFPEDAQTNEVLLSAADQALYQAKQSGRNRVVHFRSA